MIAQQLLRGLLRAVDQAAESPQVAAGQGVAGLGNDLAALDREVFEPRGSAARIDSLEVDASIIASSRGAASAELPKAAARCGSSRSVLRRQISVSVETSRDAVLYFARAAPVFSATTPLAPTANT